MSAQLDALRERVRTTLAKHLEVGVDGDGLTLTVDSSQTWVYCWETEDGSRRLVRVESPLLCAVPPTPEMFRWVAMHADDKVYGHLWCQEDEDGVMILNTHTLLGDYLDDEELLQAVYGVASTSEQLDDELQRLFGGKRYSDL